MRSITTLPRFAMVAALMGCGAARVPDGGAPASPSVSTAPAEEASVSPAPAEEATAAIPGEVTQNIATCLITVSLRPTRANEVDRGPGLRVLSLHVPELLREPPGLWPDGSAIEADAHVSAAQAREILTALGEAGFWQRAARFHNPARSDAASASPAGSSPGLPERPAGPHVVVRVTVTAGDWHLSWFSHYDWGPEARALLAAIRSRSHEPVVAAVDQLLPQLARDAPGPPG